MIEYTRCTAGRKARWRFRWCGSEVEQLTRNEQAVGSIPTTSSKNPLFSRKQRVFCMQKGKKLAAANVSLGSIPAVVSGVQLEQTGGILRVDTRTDTTLGHCNLEMDSKKPGKLGRIYPYAAG